MLPTIQTKRARNLWSDPFEAMHRELDSMLSRRWNGQGEDGSFIGHYPVDIHEDDDHVYIEAEMPGFTRNQIHVTIEAGVLTLSAERKFEGENKGVSHLTERRFTQIQRRFTLPTSVDENKVDASLADGVLHIKLTKREEVKPRRIEVK